VHVDEEIKFEWIPEPQKVPSALIALEPEQRVVSITRTHVLQLSSVSEWKTTASELAVDIQSRINRQEQGKFTIAEVAAILAKENHADGDELRERLRHAANDNELTVRDPDTAGAPNGKDKHALVYMSWVFLQDVNLLLEKWQVLYRFAWPRPWRFPMFNIPARPCSIPAELAKLPAEAQVRSSFSFARGGGTSSGSAGELVQIFQEIIERQSKEFFTVDEAAQVLAASLTGVAANTMLKNICDAHAKGSLIIRDSITQERIGADGTVKNLISHVKVSEINAWLEADGRSYRFPKAARPLDGTYSASANGTTQKQWTAERLAELKDYRDKHTMKEVAAKFGISEQRIRQLLPKKKVAPTSNSVFTHRIR
jgi:hypothetical protein